MRKLNIAYTCNVRKPWMEDERYGEFEGPDTIAAVTAALERIGANVELIDVGSDIYSQLQKRKQQIDFVFNNSEGLDEKELREAMKALNKALEAHRTTLQRWQRASGDFKSAHELQPTMDDARFNGQVVDRHIAKLVDQEEQLKQCMGGMGNKLANLKLKMNQMKGQMPGGMLPKGGDDDEDEEEDGGKKEPQKEEGKGNKEEKKDAPKGERMALTQEEAANLLNSFKLDANRKLPMGDRETAKPQDKKGKDY